MSTQQQELLPLITNTVNLGAVRLDQEGLRNLAQVVREGTAIDQVAINATHRGREYIHVGVDSLLGDPALPGFVNTVIVAANEQVVNRGHRVVTVRLMKDGPNTIYVSGYDRIWVEGKARQVDVFLGNYRSKIVGFWRKYGNNANGLIFLAMLAVLPSIPSLINRIKVIAAVFALLIVLRLNWTKAVNTRVFLHKEMVPAHIKYAEWILAFLSVIVSGFIAFLIQRYVHPA
ncbi:MAG: hypothetical protein WBW84_23480 [Acidobacteriaceae bacterium]